MPRPTTYSPAEAAELLGVSVRVLSTLRRSGQIGYLLTGTGTVKPRVRFTQADIDAHLAATHRGMTVMRGRR